MGSPQRVLSSKSRFVRRTELAPTEYRKNFHQIDHDVAIVVSSVEADRITPLMSKIYLRLTAFGADFSERPGVLRFEEKASPDGSRRTAWQVLYELLGVSSATASKALKWLHEQQIIGYSARKNGVGIRIFLNRASSSIGQREHRQQKFLPVSRTSFLDTRTSTNEVPFNDTFGVLDLLDNLKPPAAKNAAIPDQRTLPFLNLVVTNMEEGIEKRISSFASRIVQEEYQKTRAWLENYGIPKAARVAQNETFKLLRQARGDPRNRVGTNIYKPYSSSLQGDVDPNVRPNELLEADIRELAEISATMLEMNGQDLVTTINQLLGDKRSETDEGRQILEIAFQILERDNVPKDANRDIADREFGSPVRNGGELEA